MFRMVGMVEVESNDDILTIILVRLPPKSIFRFRCASKRWNDIISTPFFRQTFSTSRSPRMLAYIQETYSDVSSENLYRRNPECIAILPVPCGLNMVSRNCTAKERLYFVNSSNGLLLFQIIPQRSYIVRSPITKRMVSLTRPDSPKFCKSPALALVCEENMRELVPNYKIVVAGKIRLEHSYLIVTVFCSKTGKWTSSTPMATGSLDDTLIKYSSSTFVVDGIIHWFTRKRLYIVVYYVGSDTIQLVELPSEYRENYCLKVARSGGDDDLYLCCHMAESCHIRIWMVSREEYKNFRSRSSTIPSNAWIFMRQFQYSGPHPTPALKGERQYILNHWWSKEGFPTNVPYMAFLKVSKTTLNYILNIADKSYEKVPYHPPSDSQTVKHDDFSPYMEAFCMSSYGPLHIPFQS